MTTKRQNLKASTPMSVFALIASLIIAVFIVMFMVTSFYPSQQAIVKIPEPTDQPIPKIVPKIELEIVQPKQSIKSIVVEPAQPIPPKEEIDIEGYIKMEGENRINPKAAKYIATLLPRLNSIKLYSAEHIVAYGRFPETLKEMGIDRKDIVDGKNITHVFFYGSTILFVLNAETYGVTHWFVLTARTDTIGTQWQCQTSVRDPDNLPIECTSHSQPPYVRETK